MSQHVLQNRTRVQWITHQYHYLRGLRQIPVGIMLLILAAANAGWLSWYEFWQPLSTIVIVVLVVLAWRPINRYYATTFGQVERTPRDKMRERLLGILFIIVIYATAVAEYVWSWPVSIAYILFSGVWLWPFERIRPESPISVRYLVSALLMVGVGLLPLTGGVPATDVYITGGVSAAVLGILCIINGVLDHRMLVRFLPPVGEEA